MTHAPKRENGPTDCYPSRQPIVLGTEQVRLSEGIPHILVGSVVRLCEGRIVIEVVACIVRK